MVVPEALAPHRFVASTPISLDAASAFLATYIAHSESHPHLHPDALITPSGVKFSSAGGPMGGVVIHNLRRVAAGLRGEYLEPEATPEPEEEEYKGRKGVRRNVQYAIPLAPPHEPDWPLEEGWQVEEGWQDKSEFEREQGGDEVGDIGETNTFVKAGGEIPELLSTGQAPEGEAAAGTKRKPAQDDKEARKKAKKERNKQFKLDKEKNKATQAETED